MSGEAAREAEAIGRTGHVGRAVGGTGEVGGRFPEVFSARTRRLGVAYVLLAVLLVAAVSTLIPPGQDGYIRGYVYLASGLFTTPALVVTYLAYRRVSAADRWRWRLWFGGLILTYTTGLGMLGGLATDSGALDPAGGPLVAAITLLFMTVVMGVVRAKSGRRALSVDLTEWITCLVVVVAPAGLLWGDDILTSEHSWFALPAALATVGLISGLYWTMALLMRLRPGPWPLEITVVRIGVGLLLVGVVNGVAQVAQGLSGFTLPTAPLLTLQAACISMLLLVPLFLPSRLAATGLDGLPPQAQVRGAGLVPLVTLAGLPVLLAVTALTHDEHRWAPMFSVTVVALLLVLTVLRHLAAVSETRRLYRLVEKASEERRELLARVIQRMNDDRHAVAAQLHEQAMSAYATFVSFMTSRSPANHRALGSEGALSSASHMLRDDLAQQAESLRQLMLAIRPMAMERSRSDSLSTPVQAYVDSLYGDGPAPRLEVIVDEDLMLDWITETIVSRIVQEAIRNVWRHSEASTVAVSIRAEGGHVEVRVQDDGVGFDPGANLFESGIAAMRSFAAFGSGSLQVESTPGKGTTVIARLGEQQAPPRDPEEPGSPGGSGGPEGSEGPERPGAPAPQDGEAPARHLRLVHGGRQAGDHETAAT